MSAQQPRWAYPDEHGEWHDVPPPERSSVQIEMDSKGLAKVRVKIYEGDTAEQIQATRTLAVQNYLAAVNEVATGQVRGL